MVHEMSIGRPCSPESSPAERRPFLCSAGRAVAAPRHAITDRAAHKMGQGPTPRGGRVAAAFAAEHPGTCLAAHPPKLWYSSGLWEGAYG